MFNLLPVAKFVTQVVAGIGVSKVVGDVLKTSAVAATRMDTLRIKIGVAVISGIIAEHGTRMIDGSLDKLAALHEEKKTETEDETDLKVVS